MRTMRREAGEECWEDLEELAQDRWWWREFIKALCIRRVPQELIKIEYIRKASIYIFPVF